MSGPIYGGGMPTVINPPFQVHLLTINYLGDTAAQVFAPDPLRFHCLPARVHSCEVVGAMAIALSPVYIVQLYSPTLGFLEMAAQAIQGNARFQGQFEDWSASVPNAVQYLAQIVAYAADTSSELIVQQKQPYADGSSCLDTLLRAPLTGWDRNRGPDKYVITLRGRRASPYEPPTMRALPALIQENTTVDTKENNSIRAPLDLSVRPGDTVTYGGYLSFVVDRISYVLPPPPAWPYMQLSSK